MNRVFSYFHILEDTLLGFFLELYHCSFRKRLSHKPKFYFFDTGVAKALFRTLTLPLLPQTILYGDAKDLGINLGYCLSRDPYPRILCENIEILPWREGLLKLIHV